MLTAIVIIMIVVCVLWYGVQGLFTGLMHTVCCILAVLFAFALYEPLYNLALTRFEAGLGMSFVLVFSAFLAGLKLLFDWLVPGEVSLDPPLVNKIAGGALALPGGIIMAGAFLIGLEMMPFGTAIADYARYAPGELMSPNASVYPEPATLPLNPDGFTLGLAALASNNGLGGMPISSLYGNLLNELFVARDRVQPESRLYASPDGLISAVVYRTSNHILSGGWSAPAGSKPARPAVILPKKLLVVRVCLSDKLTADSDGVIRFKLGQVRLILSDGRFLRPMAITDSVLFSMQLKPTSTKSAVRIKPTGNVTLEFGFEDPDIANVEEILGFEFKHTARTALEAPTHIIPLSSRELGIAEIVVQ